jgi:hypothetical protein
MKYPIAFTAVLALAVGSAVQAADPIGVSGDYVEVRTAEVFTGPCMLGNEADTLGREAIMAWRVTRGAVNGISLDGLSIVAVVAGDRNLGMHELGDSAPSVVRSVVMVDERATATQRDALVSMVRSLSPNLVRDVVELKSVPIAFRRQTVDVAVRAGDARLDVTTKFEHSPVCGAMQWFGPLSSITQPQLAFARANAFSGTSLGAQWTQADRKSSFVGTFTYGGK